MDAFGAWVASQPSLPRVSLDYSDVPGGVGQDGVNRLLLGPITRPGYERALAITISYADTETGEVIEADTIFNSACAWTSVGAAKECEGKYDLRNVATHEAGHFFGLGEDYDNPSTTMYVDSLPCQTSKRTPSAIDVGVMSDFYAQPLGGQQQAQAATCSASSARREGSRRPGPVTMALVAYLWVRRRRNRGAGRDRDATRARPLPFLRLQRPVPKACGAASRSPDD